MELKNITDIKKYYSILRKCFLFDGIDEKTINDILADDRLKWISFEKNHCIYSYESFKKSLGIILNGKISVNKSKNGNDVLINYLKTGNAFGGAAVFSRTNKYIAELRAETKSDVLFVSNEVLTELCVVYQKIMLNYMSYLSDSLVFLNKRLDIFAAGGAEERLKEYIRLNAISINDNEYELYISSFSRLAEYLAIGRASLYRILDDFKAQGLIDKSGKKIYIKGDLN